MNPVNTTFYVKEYNTEYKDKLIDFLQICLPESGRSLDLEGRHSFYNDIEKYFVAFWCMFDNDKIIGTVAVKELDKNRCELKSLYLLECYHGRGLGKYMLGKAIDFSKESRYKKMYLDSLSTSEKAIRLYENLGFIKTRKYNENKFADVFMVLDLKK